VHHQCPEQIALCELLYSFETHGVAQAVQRSRTKRFAPAPGTGVRCRPPGIIVSVDP